MYVCVWYVVCVYVRVLCRFLRMVAFYDMIFLLVYHCVMIVS